MGHGFISEVRSPEPLRLSTPAGAHIAPLQDCPEFQSMGSIGEGGNELQMCFPDAAGDPSSWRPGFARLPDLGAVAGRPVGPL